MSEKFSPGPWRFGEGEDKGYILDRDGQIVAGGSWHEGYMGDDDPNDVLMCAAPELYAALQALLPIVEEYRDSGEYSGSEAAKDWPEIELAKAALAKATGQ